MGDGPPGFSRDFPCPAILRNLPSEPVPFRLPGCHRLWPIVPDRSTRALVCDSPALRPGRPCNPAVHAPRFGLFRVRSPLLAESLLFSVPAGTEMVHFPALSSTAYVFGRRYPGITPGGLPHSEISGSTLVCSSPKLIAACHVLHRLLAPRHPPYALRSLTKRVPGPNRTNRPDRKTLRHYKKLPFAEYSVVKDPAARTPRRRRAKMVENTGLEPVTSWLQTRRSPS